MRMSAPGRAESPTDGDAVHGGDHRHRSSFHTRTTAADVGDAAGVSLSGRRPARDRPVAAAIDANDEWSSPAQNELPSPGRAKRRAPTGRSHPLAGVDDPPNMRASSALRFSGREPDVGDPAGVDGDGHPVAHRPVIIACHTPQHEAAPVGRRGPDHHTLGAQASRLRSPGRAGDRGGVPRDRPAGADGIEPPGVALGRRRGRSEDARRSPTCTSRTSTSTARCPAPSTSRGTPAASASPR